METKLNPWNVNNKLISKSEIESILGEFEIDHTINNLSIYQQVPLFINHM